MKFPENSKEFDIGLAIRIKQVDKNKVKKIKKKYKNKSQDWSQFKDKVKQYNPFFYTQKASNYPSNKNKWLLQDELISQNQIYVVHMSFYQGEEKHRERRNISSAVIVKNKDDDIVLQRCYYVGCKEPIYGELIGTTHILNDLLNNGIKKIIINSNTKVFEGFLKNQFKEEDPYQEKTSDILKESMLKFDQIKIQKFEENAEYFETKNLAQWVQTDQMKSFLDRVREANQVKNIIEENINQLQIQRVINQGFIEF